MSARLVVQLVVDEVVEGDDGSDDGGEVNGEHHVVGLNGESLYELLNVEVWQQIEHVLQLVDDA
eukprot:6188586-Pleurochrysis_carterae.AAC.3